MGNGQRKNREDQMPCAVLFVLDKIRLFHYNIPMSHVFDFNDAQAYDRWLKKDGNQRIVDLENRLLVEMLRPKFGDRLLDIGCGAGPA